MNKVEGLHHIAICTADMKAQIEYFTDVLGMELVALYWMHGVANTWHGFLRLNDESSIAFVCNPDIDEDSGRARQDACRQSRRELRARRHAAPRAAREERRRADGDARPDPLEGHSGARAARSRLSASRSISPGSRICRWNCRTPTNRSTRARGSIPEVDGAGRHQRRWNSRATRSRPTTKIRAAPSSNRASMRPART